MKTILAVLIHGTVLIATAAVAATESELPARGATVDMTRIRELCLARGWTELWENIEKNPPARKFVVGSCADWSKPWEQLGLYPAWLRHGLEYWAGAKGDEVGRLRADSTLMLAVADATKSAEAGLAVFNHVRQSGSAQSDNAFKWGFGRQPAAETVESRNFGQKFAAKLRPVEVPGFVRSYEPMQLGLTKDSRDESFMDFQLSVMFPLYGAYPDRMPEELSPGFRFGDFAFRNPEFFASATVRAGQYIETRPSSPVVGKRFNPQLFARFWARDRAGFKSSPDKYLDLIFFAHESNGQAIGTEADFLRQKEVYRLLEKQPNTPNAELNATRWAHDSISRGWDYVGAEVGWSWSQEYHPRVNDVSVQVDRSLRVKVRHFLPWGLAQKHAEEYRPWEGDGPAHPRRNYDGIKVQYIVVSKFLDQVPLFTGKGTFTYTTGLSHPFEHSTFEADLGFKIGALPLSLWGRVGYNSDLADYYRQESGYGFRLSLW